VLVTKRPFFLHSFFAAPGGRREWLFDIALSTMLILGVK
jgi:hypothetical protein